MNGSITEHCEISTLTSAFELVVLTDWPPGPEERMKFLTISEFLRVTSRKVLNLDVEKVKNTPDSYLSIDPMLQSIL